MCLGVSLCPVEQLLFERCQLSVLSLLISFGLLLDLLDVGD